MESWEIWESILTDFCCQVETSTEVEDMIMQDLHQKLVIEH